MRLHHFARAQQAARGINESAKTVCQLKLGRLAKCPSAAIRISGTLQMMSLSKLVYGWSRYVGWWMVGRDGGSPRGVVIAQVRIDVRDFASIASSDRDAIRRMWTMKCLIRG